MFGLTSFAKKQRNELEREKMAQLERAESDVDLVRDRAVRVHERLSERQRRNHWREAIEQMIQGAT